MKTLMRESSTDLVQNIPSKVEENMCYLNRI